MAIRIIKTDTFVADVFIRQPGSDQDESFKATFRHLGDDQVKQRLTDLRTARITQEALLDELLVSVSGIADEHGKPLDPDTAMAWVRGNIAAVNACGWAWMREVSGASEKNVSRSRGR